jgi:hypothetical protein
MRIGRDRGVPKSAQCFSPLLYSTIRTNSLGISTQSLYTKFPRLAPLRPAAIDQNCKTDTTPIAVHEKCIAEA